MSVVSFVIPGCPVPKERARAGKWGHYTPARTRAYERSVALIAQAAGARPTESPVTVRMTFYLPDHRRRDLDNLVKSVWDGLNRVAFRDDSQITYLEASKLLDREHPRVWVRIEECGKCDD